MVTAATSAQVKRHYFGNLNIKADRLTLSMLTGSFLSPDLVAIKKATGTPLIQFEDAKVELSKTKLYSIFIFSDFQYFSSSYFLHFLF